MQKLILANNNATHACNNILVGQIPDITSQQFTTSEKQETAWVVKFGAGPCNMDIPMTNHTI